MKIAQAWIKQALFIWLILFVAVGVMLYAIKENLADRYRSEFNLNSQLGIQHIVEQLQGGLFESRRNLEYLSRLPTLRQYMAEPSEKRRLALSQSLVQFVRSFEQTYDQARLIAPSGDELIRINNNPEPHAVNEQELQNKLDRYYLQEALEQPPGQIYISRLDLNIEHQQIERPFKPVIRIAMPLYHDGEIFGVLVLNHLLRDLFEHIRSENQSSAQRYWIVDQEGYWLVAETPELEWGAILPERSEAKIQNRYPEIWQAIQQQDLGKIEFADQSELVFESIKNNRQQWTVLSYLSRQELLSMQAQSNKILLLSWFGSGLLLLFLIGLFMRLLNQKQDANLSEKISRLSFEALSDAAPDAVLIIDMEGKIVFSNQRSEQLFLYSKAEFNGMPIENLIPEKYRAHHQQHRKSYSLLPNRRSMSDSPKICGLRADKEEIPVMISLGPVMMQQHQLTICMIRPTNTSAQILAS